MRKFKFLLAGRMLTMSAPAQQKTITGMVPGKTTNEPLQALSGVVKNRTIFHHF